MTPRIAFIGLGHMGGPMCARVVAAGFPVAAYDLQTRALTAAVAAGASAARSAADAARTAGVVVTMLPGPAQVEDVLLGSGGVLAALPAGGLVIDMSTSSAAVGRRVAEAAHAQGSAFVDAPVADALRAAEGMLNVFVGGAPADVARARPVLEAMGDPERIWHVGPAGAGYATKLLVNLQWFVHAAAAAEALVVGARAGLDVRTLHGVLASGPGRSSFIEHEALEVLEAGEYGERFPLGLVAKDLALVLDLARETGIETPVSAATGLIYERARERFGDHGGEMGAVRLHEELAQTELRFEARPDAA
jgi:3-hydroxyisobutyrate dehydrogenase